MSKTNKIKQEKKPGRFWEIFGIVISFLIMGMIYVISPLDLFPGSPIDDIIVAVLSLASGVVSIIVSVKNGNDNPDVSDKLGMARKYALSAKEKKQQKNEDKK